VLLSSSLILGLFIFFIFIGIGIFSDGEDPFAAVVNAGLTLSAGLGDAQRCFSAFAAIATVHVPLTPNRTRGLLFRFPQA
jgi:hypothetical protein